MTTDDSTEGYSLQYSPSDDGQPSVAVVKAVASLKNVDYHELQPLHFVVDTDLLNGAFVRRRQKSQEAELSITFRYEDYKVTIDDERIRVEAI